MQLHLGSTKIGFMARAIANSHQRIHFFRAEADDTARAMILEAAAENPLAAGQNGGGNCVSGQAGHRLAVEGEMDFPGAVDQAAAAAEAIGLAAHAFDSAAARLAKYSAHGPFAAAINSAGGKLVIL